MSVKLTVKGLERFAAAFAKLDGDLPRVLRLIAKGVGHEVKSEAMIYPPQHPDVTYVRTNRLKNAWHVQEHGKTGAIVGNPIPYAPFAHDPDRQTQVMAGYNWRTTEKIVEDTERKGAVQAAADKVMGRVLRAVGLA